MDRYDFWKQLHTYRHTLSGAVRFEMWFAGWCQAYWLFQFVLYRCCNTENLWWNKQYAHQFLETEGPNLKPYSIVHGWKVTNPEEVRTFLGVCVLMSLIHKPRIWMYWSTDTLYNTPFFGQLMTRTRFLLLNKFLHFQDNQHPGYDPNDPYRDTF